MWRRVMQKENLTEIERAALSPQIEIDGLQYSLAIKNNMRNVLEGLKAHRLPSLQDIKSLCDESVRILCQLPNVMRIAHPVVVVGDLRGGLFELLEILEQHGEDTSYIFLGNFSGGGSFCLETFLLLLCLFVKSPNLITLLRGTFEVIEESHSTGLLWEAIKKYGGNRPWRLLSRVFGYLPVAAVVDNAYLAVARVTQLDFSSNIDSLRGINRLKGNSLCERQIFNSSAVSRQEQPLDPFSEGLRLQQFLRENRLKKIIQGASSTSQNQTQQYSDSLLSVCSCVQHNSKGSGAILVITRDDELSWSEVPVVQSLGPFTL